MSRAERRGPPGDGRGVQGGGRDCFAESLFCQDTLGCGEYWQENHGSSSCTPNSYEFVGNVYEATENTTIFSFGMRVSMTVAETFEHVVYEGNSVNGPFTEIHTAERTGNVGELIYFGGGVVDVTAGKFYVVGVRSSGANVTLCSPLNSSGDAGTGSTISTSPTNGSAYNILRVYQLQ